MDKLTNYGLHSRKHNVQKKEKKRVIPKTLLADVLLLFLCSLVNPPHSINSNQAWIFFKQVSSRTNIIRK